MKGHRVIGVLQQPVDALLAPLGILGAGLQGWLPDDGEVAHVPHAFTRLVDGCLRRLT